MTKRETFNLRLSAEDRRMLDALAHDLSCPRATALRILIKRAAETLPGAFVRLPGRLAPSIPRLPPEQRALPLLCERCGESRQRGEIPTHPVLRKGRRLAYCVACKGFFAAASPPKRRRRLAVFWAPKTG